ncbi:hypothetical protein R3P38DRAFT_2775585 [Favolaschia claudopus]|uniref:Uncharacterized protein n=1 Tax=Favolaschia claudopus TaxID=2862362 RepID=A0AAW0BW51_9AGAR
MKDFCALGVIAAVGYCWIGFSFSCPTNPAIGQIAALSAWQFFFASLVVMAKSSSFPLLDVDIIILLPVPVPICPTSPTSPTHPALFYTISLPARERLSKLIKKQLRAIDGEMAPIALNPRAHRITEALRHHLPTRGQGYVCPHFLATRIPTHDDGTRNRQWGRGVGARGRGDAGGQGQGQAEAAAGTITPKHYLCTNWLTVGGAARRVGREEGMWRTMEGVKAKEKEEQEILVLIRRLLSLPHSSWKVNEKRSRGFRWTSLF